MMLNTWAVPTLQDHRSNFGIISTNISIGHDGIAEYGAEKIGIITSFSSIQIASSEINIPHISTLSGAENFLVLNYVCVSKFEFSKREHINS